MKPDNSKINKCWQEANLVLENVISEETYRLHIKPIILEYKDEKIYLTAVNEFSKKLIEKNYLGIIKEIFQKKLGFSAEINLVTVKKTAEKEEEKEEKPEIKPIRSRKKPTMDSLSMPLNPEFCFETFIIGENNRLATACAEAISKQPGKIYNPLFLYGDSGLGKTHLMQAIGNKIYEQNNYSNIFYTTGENFTALYVEALRENKLQTLRQKIRSFDLFLLDDIQFLMKKEGTITEFFHTFNALFESGKQIVLTSDRAPKDLDMDERLLSRFEQGMFIDIKKPNFETRLAILKDKTKRENMDFRDDVLEYIANLIKDNIRRLQGALTHLIAQASFNKKEITLEFAKETLDNYYNTNPKIIDINIIQEKTAKYYNVTLGDLIGQSRVKDIVFARQVSMYLARELTEMSLPAIGKAFGKRDHTTVIHSCKKIEEKLSEDPKYRQVINELIGEIVQN